LKRVFGALPTRYAQALFQAAKQGNVLSEVENDLHSLEETLADHTEFASAMMNPGLTDAEVRAILNSLSSELNLHPVTRQFIDLLLEKRRLELIPTIPSYFHKLYLLDQGEVEVRVSTAIDLDEAWKTKIHAHLEKQSGKKPRISWATRPEILGGLIIEWPDSVHDGSLARKLRVLEERMIESV
jgi:F-type H+-transporting ATPase subunit delta